MTWLAIATAFVLLGAWCVALIRDRVRRGEEAFALIGVALVLVVCIYLGGHSLLAFARAI